MPTAQITRRPTQSLAFDGTLKPAWCRAKHLGIVTGRDSHPAGTVGSGGFKTRCSGGPLLKGRLRMVFSSAPCRVAWSSV